MEQVDGQTRQRPPTPYGITVSTVWWFCLERIKSLCELPYLNYSHNGHHGDNSTKQQSVPIGEQTVLDCPSIFKLTVNVTERIQSGGSREQAIE
jgi:hypothetical protein